MRFPNFDALALQLSWSVWMDITNWLLNSPEPWTRCRTLVDLLDAEEREPRVQAARAEMLAHPQVHELIVQAGTWPGHALRRHNDASHPLHLLSVLADFGVRSDDEGMPQVVKAILAHQAAEGAFQTVVMIPRAFGGDDSETWTWMACDMPTLLYALLAFGLHDEHSVQRAVNHLLSLAADNGWRCAAAPAMGKFKGPGRRSDPCPIATVYALKALGQIPALLDDPAVHQGSEMLLTHWALRQERKYYLFGMGTDFRKLKYPLVWYDLLHVVDVLSRFPFVHADARFQEMLRTLLTQIDGKGRYTAGSMYTAWKGWSFADKKNASPWLTFKALHIERCIQREAATRSKLI
jgi:hypothetical protein